MMNPEERCGKAGSANISVIELESCCVSGFFFHSVQNAMMQKLKRNVVSFQDDSFHVSMSKY